MREGRYHLDDFYLIPVTDIFNKLNLCYSKET